MAKMEKMNETLFEKLIENISDYKCVGMSRHIDDPKDKWDSLHFKHCDEKPFQALDFFLSHPHSRIMGTIDYSMIEVRFSSTYPIPQEWGFRITDKKQVARLTKAVENAYARYCYDTDTSGQG